MTPLHAADLEAVIDCALRDGIEKIVVGAIISKGGAVLGLRRKHDDYLGGIDELPSGHVEQEEGVLDALRREVKEETGLTVTQIHRLESQFDYLTGSGKKARQFNFVVDVSDSGKTIILSEHSAYCWAGPKEVQALNLSEKTRNALAQFWQPRD